MEKIKNLVDISDEEIAQILKNLDAHKEKIQLLDYLEDLGLPRGYIEEISKIHDRTIPPERREYFQEYKRTILSLRTVDSNLSNLRLNPFTAFEKHPPLFFGMGGGSKALCKGLPFDVLGMVLTAEKMKRKLDLSEARILLANRITYTNIPKNPEFSEASIDAVMKSEKDLLELVIEKFGFKNWKVFLQTDLESIVGTDIKERYERLIELADRTNLVGGHHYSIEMADIWSLVGQGDGGIKLGWFMRNIDKKNGGYIMDEQPFHARFNLFLALQNMQNNVTLSYANAGARLYPGPTGELEKESPYICYQPHNRLLLSPFERPSIKLANAASAGGGLESRYYRNLMSGIVILFEELVLGSGNGHQPNRIGLSGTDDDSEHDALIKKIEFIERFIFDGEKEAEKVWKRGFPHSLP